MVYCDNYTWIFSWWLITATLTLHLLNPIISTKSGKTIAAFITINLNLQRTSTTNYLMDTSVPSLIHSRCLTWASQEALVVKNSPANVEDKRHRFDPWIEKIPWKRAWTYFSILAWKIPWTEKTKGLQFMLSQRIRHNWAHASTVCYLKKRLPLFLCAMDKKWLTSLQKWSIIIWSSPKPENHSLPRNFWPFNLTNSHF